MCSAPVIFWFFGGFSLHPTGVCSGSGLSCSAWALFHVGEAAEGEEVWRWIFVTFADANLHQWSSAGRILSSVNLSTLKNRNFSCHSDLCWFGGHRHYRNLNGKEPSFQTLRFGAPLSQFCASVTACLNLLTLMGYLVSDLQCGEMSLLTVRAVCCRM